MKPNRIIVLPALLALLSILLGVGPSGAVLPAHAAPMRAVENFYILLGRPTDHSITINMIPDESGEVAFEYGTTSGTYGSQTGMLTATAGEPVEAVVDGLSADTQYYYRALYRVDSGSPWTYGPEYTFHTQRLAGEEFTFTITADSHLNHIGTSSRYEQTTLNIFADHPDFHIDLGDAFNMDGPDTQAEANEAYLDQRLPSVEDDIFLSNFSHSAPIFLAIGNHENEEGWNFDDSPSQALMSAIARKTYYLNPIPDGEFYTGNTDTLAAIGGDGLREDYYAWTWGDALFVVLNPFHYTMTMPYDPIAGEDGDEVIDKDQWHWTLGEAQYNWLKETLEGSDAKFKFVFSHHVTGGQLSVSSGAGGPGYVRGGAKAADYFEWGGHNADGTWGFDTQRPGWEKPVHQLLVDNQVSAFFHGHDHEYAYEVVDGIVYQEVPSPSMTGYGFSLYTEGNPPETIRVLPNSGHLRVTIHPDQEQAHVEYVRSVDNNGDVSHDYYIDAAGEPPNEYTITASAGEHGSILPAGAVTVTEGSDRVFTITPDSGYQVADVLVDGVSVGAVTSYTFTDVQADHTIEAGFIEKPPANITYIGELGSAMIKDSNDDVLTITTTAPAAAGQDIVIAYATDPSQNLAVSVTDSAGNTYTQIGYAVNQAQLRTYIFAAFNIGSPLPGGSTISFTQSNGTPAARAAVASLFDGLADVDVVDRTSTGSGNSSSTPSSGTTGATTEADELLIGAIGTEGPASDTAGSWLNDFVAGPRVGTDEGTADTNITASMGYRIVSATGAYAAAKSNIAARDYAAMIATLKAGSSSQHVDYTITATAGEGGSIDPSGDVVVTEGGSQAFTITPGSGYRVADVLVDGVSVGAVSTYTFNDVQANHTIAATFEIIPSYIITASSGAGGSIDPAGEVTVLEGDSRAFTITPGSGYTIADVLVDGVSVGAVSTYTFSDVQANHTIAAGFAEAVTYTITATADANGSIDPSGAVVVTEGADQTFTIIPGSGYQVADVWVDGVSMGAVTTYTFTNVQANHVIAAGFEEAAAGEDFSIIVLPDTQYYSDSYPEIFTSQTQWIADNWEALNVAFVAHEGDIVNSATSSTQWANANTSMGLLDSAGVPYGVLPGNHDLQNFTPGNSTQYNTHFGVSRFEGRDYYAGVRRAGYNDDNYNLFSAGGIDFILINVGYLTANHSSIPDVVAWADGLLKAYPERRGILVTHYLMETNGSFGGPGQAIYDGLKDNTNLFLMLCGHMHDVARRVDTNDDGYTIHSILADYQGEANGGNGFLRIMTFSPANGTIQVQSYSPYLDEYRTDDENQFVLPLDNAPQPPPDVPALVSPVDGFTTDDNTPTFSWEAVDGAITYQIRADNNLDFSSPEIDATVAGTSHTAASSLANGTYYWQVRAGNGSSWSDYSSFRSLTIDVPVPDEWTAYNDCVYESGDIGDNVTIFGVGDTFSGETSGMLLDQTTGVPVGVTAALAETGGVYWYTGSGANPAEGTDAYNTFAGIANMDGVIFYGDEGWTVDLTFTGLDPDRQYTFATSASRDGSYTDRFTRFTLSSVDAAVNASTPGVEEIDPLSVYFNTGDNNDADEGFVARWQDIEPGEDGSFTVRAQAHVRNEAYAFSVFMLHEQASAAPDVPVLVAPEDGSTTDDSTPTFDWNDVTGAAEYQIQVAGDDGFTDPVIDTTTTASTYTPDTALTNGTYYWHVRAGNGSAWSDYSEARAVTISALPPAPELVSPTDGSTTNDRTPTFDWSDVADVSYYYLQVSNNAELVGLQVNTWTVGSAYTPVTALESGTYYWRVKTRDTMDTWGNWSETWSVVLDGQLLPAPELVSPEDSSMTNDLTPYFDWNEVEGASYYRLQIDDDADFSSLLFNYRAGTSAYAVGAPLISGTYYWRVQACDAMDTCGVRSTSWSLVTNGELPPAPELISPTDSSTSADLTPTFDWSDVADVSYYYLQVSDNAEFIGLQINTWTVGSAYTPTTALESGTYYWRVKTRDTMNTWGGWSEIWSVSLDGQLLPAPELVSPEDGSTTNDLTPLFDWSEVEGASYYRLQIDDDADFSSLLFNYRAGTSAYAIGPSLVSGTYYWRVQTCDATDSCGAYSISWSIVTGGELPPAPVLLSPADGSTTNDLTPTFDWSDVADVSYYYLQVSNNAEFIGLQVNTWTVSSAYTPTTALESGTYYWRVKTRDTTNTWGDWSEVWSVVLDGEPSAVSSVTDNLLPAFSAVDVIAAPVTTINKVVDKARGISMKVTV